MASSSTCSSSNSMNRFMLMGFSEEMVVKAVKENGENDETVLDALLTYKTLDETAKDELVPDGCQDENMLDDSSDEEIWENEPLDEPAEEELVPDDPCHAEPTSGTLDVSSEDESWETEESTNPSAEKDRTVSLLVEMGYEAEEASDAIDKCGVDTPMEELLEYIAAAQFAHCRDLLLGEELRHHQQQMLHGPDYMSKNKRKLDENEVQKLLKQPMYPQKQPLLDYDNEIVHFPNPMIGFGVPNESLPTVQRRIPDEAKGPPFFYFENVAFAPKGVWHTMSHFLYDIDPEFVDSKFFSAAARKRGYIHNLPIHNRFQVLPIAPPTIQEAFPHTKEFWPPWDTRTKLNCVLTCVGCAKFTERIKKAIEESGDEPSPDVKKHVIQQCKKWNFIWVGKNKTATLEPQEVELLMGFPQNHTRGGGITRKDQYTVLGNSFQVDTVAYHLSALKSMFPDGINVLSLFSGIGGAEVALHRLGITLKNVASVEISEACREILQSWWKQTNQKGNLIHFHDVQLVTIYELDQWMSKFGGFDLIIGGSPCNNISGANRSSRNGLKGAESSLFYDYYRILDLVRSMMRNRRY